MARYPRWKEERPLSPDAKAFLNFLGWTVAMMFNPLTLPLWVWLIGGV